MAVLRTSLLTLMLVYTTYSSPSPVSARDQYEAGEDWSQPPQLFNEATDQSLKMHKIHRFGLPLKNSVPEVEPQENDIVPDLQVGCGDGFIVEPTATDKKSKFAGLETLKQRRRRNVNDPERKRRNYYPYYHPATHVIRTPASISYSSVWRPQPYQIARPYYIPIFGPNGKVPLYFPSQSVLLNPGFPVDNPMVIRKTYLPPTTTTTSKPVISIGPKFGEAEEGPSWGVATRPPPSTSRPVPPRRTRRPGQTTTTPPPLVHSSDNGEKIDDIFNNQVEQDVPPSNVQSQLDDLFPRPTVAPPPPVVQTQRPGREREPMNCVFAIISCCSASSNEVDLDCFEARGCPGPFWGSNPCDRRFANAALGSADTYFNA